MAMVAERCVAAGRLGGCLVPTGEREHRSLEVHGREGGGVIVVERTSGPLTGEVYQVPRHVHGIVADGAATRVVGELLGMARAAKEDGSPAAEEAFGLVDLLDELDARGLRYAYFSEYGGSVVWRPARLRGPA